MGSTDSTFHPRLQEFGFLGLTSEDSDYASARFAVLPVPYDATTSYGVGARYGPEAILSASEQVEFFDEELGRECFDQGIVTLSAVMPDARGPAETHEKLHRVCRDVMGDGKFLLTLGGEHGISSAPIRAALEAFGPLSVLQIDAHTDLRDQYQDSPYSHACVMRRAFELGAKLVAVGIRATSAEEQPFIAERRIPIFKARDLRGRQVDGWVSEVVSRLEHRVYLTVDIDGFDPAYAPGTGTPEPGGLDWYEVTALLRAVAKSREIIAADIVEVSPIPGQHVTEFLAARLAYKIMSYVACLGKPQKP